METCESLTKYIHMNELVIKSVHDHLDVDRFKIYKFCEHNNLAHCLEFCNHK